MQATNDRATEPTPGGPLTRGQAYYRANRDRIKARQREYWLKNRDARLAWQQQYYQANKARVNARSAEYKRRNKDAVNARARELHKDPARRAKRKEYKDRYLARLRAINPPRVPFSPEELKRRRRESYRRWCKKHPDYQRTYKRKWRLANPERIRSQELRTTHGMSWEDYQRMVAERQGLCDICRQKPVGGNSTLRALHIDHDHSTGATRGLLCGPCNKGLGHFADNIARMEAAIAYLRLHGSQTESPQS